MLSALETWINDKSYVGMVYMKQTDPVTAVKIVRVAKAESTYNVKFPNNKDIIKTQIKVKTRYHIAY